MSSRATSVRPSYITIPTSRARLPPYIPLPDPSDPFTEQQTPFHPLAPADSAEHATIMPDKYLAYFSSLFPQRTTEKMYSLSSEESSSVDSLSLPLPGSPQQPSFSWQDEATHFRVAPRRDAVSGSSGSFSVRWHFPVIHVLILTIFLKAYAPPLLVLLLFPLSSMLMIASIYSLPITASFPRTLADLADLARELQAYFQSGLESKAHVLAVLSVTALWKHAWSVPGSVLLVRIFIIPFLFGVYFIFL